MKVTLKFDLTQDSNNQWDDKKELLKCLLLYGISTRCLGMNQN